MKKQTFFGSMVLVFIFCLFGQVASSQVSTPSNIIVTGQYVGSSNGVDVEFKAANIRQAIILQSTGFFWNRFRL